MLLVFIGGKGAPSGLVVGKVYELSPRHANFPYYQLAPEGAVIDQVVPVKPRAMKTPEPKRVFKKLTIAPGFKGKVNLRFDAKAKSAPKGEYKDGLIYELPARYASFPWFNLVEPIPEVKIELIEEESIYKDDKPFISDRRDGLQSVPLSQLKHPEKSISETPLTEEQIKVEEKPVEAKPDETLKEEKAPEQKHKAFNDMSKDELTAFVKEKGGEVIERDSKRTLIGKALALDVA